MAERVAGQVGLFLWAFLFGAVVNVLMLTGPLYMLQVYDRVLAARSVETLVALSLIAGLAFLAMGVTDHVRGRILARAGARYEHAQEARIFRAAAARLALVPGDAPALGALRDLAAIRQVCAAPVMAALFDLPFAPLFVAAIFVFHPWLGWLSLAGGAVLVALTLAQERLTRQCAQAAAQTADHADRLADSLLAEAPVMRGLGMQGAGLARWQALRAAALAQTMVATDRAGGFGAAVRALRILLQSAVLGLGALLALRGDLSAGAMIAASILFGRALAPVDVAVGQWALVTRAQGARARLRALLAVHGEPPRMPLPRPAPRLEVQGLSVVPPGTAVPTLRGLSFTLEPGSVLGVIGPSGSGKSTLARALAGLWPATSGQTRLGGATLDRYSPDTLGALLGYLPQGVTLFPGTVACNIARLSPDPDPQAVVAAATSAGAHDMILSLPQGYDTVIGPGGAGLSGGQVQRIGLARALYGDPVLLILDEPDSHLDADGSAALAAAIRSARNAGRAVMVMAHRPGAIAECDTLLMLEGGQRRAYGPRDQVLRQTLAAPVPLRTAGVSG